MEYMPCGSLAMRKQHHAATTTPIPSSLIIRWLLQLCSALQFLHAHCLVQRDLKPSNIFLTESEDIKLGACGNEESLAHSASSSPQYLAPELLVFALERSDEDCSPFQYVTTYSAAADLWSVGVLLFELLVLERPFESECFDDLIQKIMQAHYVDEILLSCDHPLVLQQLASRQGLLEPRRERRMMLPELQEHLLGLIWVSTTHDVSLLGLSPRHSIQCKGGDACNSSPSQCTGATSSSLTMPSLNLEELSDHIKWTREELQSALQGTSLIPHTHLTLCETLGHGTYAVVHRGVWRIERKSVEVAIKKLHELPEDQLAAFSPRAQACLCGGICRDPRFLMNDSEPSLVV